MKLSKKQRVNDVYIERYAFGGTTIARVADATVLVRGAIPGESVDLDVNWAARPPRGQVVHVLTASSDRITPCCSWVNQCGGCDWMHMRFEAQTRAHVELVKAALVREIPNIVVPTVTINRVEPIFHYRDRVRFHAKREKNRMRVGYLEFEKHEIVPIDSCAVLHSDLDKILPLLQELFSDSTGEGQIHATRNGVGGVVLDIIWEGSLSNQFWKHCENWTKLNQIAGIQVMLHSATCPVVFGNFSVVMLGVDAFPLQLSPNGFAQTSAVGSRILGERVLALAKIDRKEHREIVELFAGSGTLSIFLVTIAKAFLAVESDEQAARCLRENLKAREMLSTSKIVVGDASIYSMKKNIDLVVMDPPRTGSIQSVSNIAKARAKSVVYVSCDPTTLARDTAHLLSNGYGITHLETVELFPQTSHVETIMRLERQG